MGNGEGDMAAVARYPAGWAAMAHGFEFRMAADSGERYLAPQRCRTRASGSAFRRFTRSPAESLELANEA